MPAHLTIVDPATRRPELGSYNNIALASRLPVSLHLPALFGPDSLQADREEVSGVIIFGSAASVHDNHPWQKALITWLEPLIAAHTPIFGICYGHQLLATIFGGVVGYAFPDRTKKVGMRRVTFAATKLWPAQAGELVVSHEEAVVQVPPPMRVIAHSPEISVDGLEHVELPIWSLQSHPESSLEFVERIGLGTNGFAVERLQFGHALIRCFLRFSEQRMQ